MGGEKGVPGGRVGMGGKIEKPNQEPKPEEARGSDEVGER